jgi:hypothetical protein
VSDTAREALALRAIVVSGRAALRTTSDAEREAVQDRIDELLAQLEEIVIRNGGNEAILAAIEAERRSMRD